MSLLPIVGNQMQMAALSSSTIRLYEVLCQTFTCFKIAIVCRSACGSVGTCSLLWKYRWCLFLILPPGHRSCSQCDSSQNTNCVLIWVLYNAGGCRPLWSRRLSHGSAAGLFAGIVASNPAGFTDVSLSLSICARDCHLQVWRYQMLYNTILTSWWWAKQCSKHVEAYKKLVAKQDFVH